jgi:hypothetical protein
MKIELEGFRAELDIPAKAAWEIVQFATTKVEHGEGSGTFCSSPNRTAAAKGPPGTTDGRSTADRIRQIARELLADGHPHERREISAAVRKVGLGVGYLDGALKSHFERGENVLGRPTYRDPTVDPPQRRGTKPRWVKQAEKPRDVEGAAGIEVVGKLGSNASDPNG